MNWKDIKDLIREEVHEATWLYEPINEETNVTADNTTFTLNPEDIDVGVNRSKVDLALWKKRDPIKRLLDGLVKEGLFSEKEFEVLDNKIKMKIDILWEKATKDRSQSDSDLQKYLYSK